MAALRSSLRHYRLFSSSSTRPTTISTTKSKLKSKHDPDKSLKLYIEPSSDSPSRYPLDVTVKRLAKSRRFDDVEALIESHKKNPNITQESYFSTLLRAYGTAGMASHALRLYEQMGELGTPRSSVSFNALLTAHNAGRKFDQVPKLFNEIPEKYGVTPDKISYGVLIKSYCELSLPESAFTILKEMEKNKIEATTIIYTTIIDALYKKGKAEEAERIWKEMVEKGCKPDVGAYNVRIMHAHHGKPEGVLALMNEMTAAGLKPDVISQNYLYSCYCKNGMMEDAKKVYQGLGEGRGFKNSATFRLHVFYLCKHGKFDEAYEVFRESVRRDKIPSFGTMKILAEGLVKNSKMDEAKWLVKVVKKKSPANFLDSWNKLEAELGLGDSKASPDKEASATLSKSEESSGKKASATSSKSEDSAGEKVFATSSKSEESSGKKASATSSKSEESSGKKASATSSKSEGSPVKKASAASNNSTSSPVKKASTASV